jgi:maltose alpha-D-glucosyltransferase/alpha-amylase
MASTSRTDSLWYKDAVIYELHVRAFSDSSGDGVGDFAGLTAKLDYLQDLGVTAIWLLPFYPSPLRDDGYDIADYRDVHPDYGSLADFRRFVREAHRRNLKVITELVVNHTSDQHPWFQAARRAKPGSARRELYVWSDTDQRFAETRIIFTDTESSNWAWDAEAGAYYWHRFFSHQPDLNHNNPRVVDAVARVMRFWCDMGVDGLRLDAVPYLCVRDGTTNENLPETHAVIKEFRRRLDERFSNRMLLAEANQWPDDVRPYFGDGDECHMAFHFPLMPRIFMAIRREDRFPIVDILKQTPEIPDSCQWALFLRNHDELTLEMVTDEERDYMYREYAKDRQMRLNVGIRRRLAPLVDNSRRRIELLNSLLFSFPGTPVVYYGDEIGMGDNIYLGDRNGVRTPMQWSADRNAGFSKADPQRLYLPVIMDPVHGYQAVNVEAQQRSPSSLLHFMKRLIALRRQHRTFGRGSMEILEPANRKVLAYLRRYRGEVILAVANLSRFAQAVELDLREFNGRTPVELFGRTEFPRIGELPYLLTLGPHSFLWFRLEAEARPIPLPPSGEAPRPEAPTVAVDGGPERLLEHRYELERQVLPGFLPRQRWFRSKARDIAELRIADQVKLGAGFFVLFVRAMYGDGGAETYALPVKIARGGLADTVRRDVPESIVCHVAAGDERAVLFDALADGTACRDLLSFIADGRRFPTDADGRIAAYPTVALGDEGSRDPESTEVRRMAVEQSNTSVVLGDELIIKWFRKVEEGPNPDVEIGAFLTERSPFSNVPPVLGGIDYQLRQGPPATLAMLQAFVPNRGDGWSWAVDRLEALLRDEGATPVGATGPTPASALLGGADQPGPQAAVGEAAGLLAAVGRLGVRTAELHLALAGEPRDPAFAPEPMTGDDVAALADGFLAQAQHALGLLDSRLADLPEAVRPRAEEVLALRPELVRRFQQLRELDADAGRRIRCHGDYHLGQVLRTDDDFLILDFEGEPLVPMAERRRKQSPLKDVAGMLRSFSYATQTAAARAAGVPDPDAAAHLEGPRLTWERWCSATFLRAYLAVAGTAELLPQSPALGVLLDAFVLDKAFYELAYELNNRPRWLLLPLAGIAGAVAAPGEGSDHG